MKKVRFEAPLVAGHKGVVVAIVPFDPEEAWGQKPVKLAGRRHGWLVKGTVAGAKIAGYVGERWGRFFVIVDEVVREVAAVAVGDDVVVTLTPTDDDDVLAKAIEQSKLTTQPGKARADVVDVARSKRRTR